MKNWKTKLAMALVTCASASVAQADMSYKWVQLSSQQMRANKSYCDEVDHLIGTFSKVGAGVGALSVSASLLSAKEALVVAPGSLSITSGLGMVSLGLGAFELYKTYFKNDEIFALIFELQANRPGLMVEKLQQVALENNVDGNRLLAGLNIMAVQGEVCGRSAGSAHDKDLKDLVGQEGDRASHEQEDTVSRMADRERAEVDSVNQEHSAHETYFTAKLQQEEMALQDRQEAAIANQLAK
jgi:hypothetical protein